MKMIRYRLAAVPITALACALASLAAAQTIAPPLNGGAPTTQLNGGPPRLGLAGGPGNVALSGGSGSVALSGGPGSVSLSGGNGLIGSAMLPGPLVPFGPAPSGFTGGLPPVNPGLTPLPGTTPGLRPSTSGLTPLNE